MSFERRQKRTVVCDVCDNECVNWRPTWYIAVTANGRSSEDDHVNWRILRDNFSTRAEMHVLRPVYVRIQADCSVQVGSSNLVQGPTRLLPSETSACSRHPALDEAAHRATVAAICYYHVRRTRKIRRPRSDDSSRPRGWTTATRHWLICFSRLLLLRCNAAEHRALKIERFLAHSQTNTNLLHMAARRLDQHKQESRATARKPRDAASVLFR